MTAPMDFDRALELLRAWNAFVADYCVTRHVDMVEHDYKRCRKLAQKGVPLAFNQWEDWLRYWGEKRLTR
ncbi:hypothetical protein QTI66_32705 [Variovorax sp. J22R133]|uniref:hypothetical protein n=1 Tax=Variovorax brevis TaxID=3053503 RepID=UPI00257513CA|nr:hypothetical protein [Variovorax sp. J22R133]MDM0116889.1 hypothetical protein [Variovorax sp. J22R133]